MGLRVSLQVATFHRAGNATALLHDSQCAAFSPRFSIPANIAGSLRAHLACCLRQQSSVLLPLSVLPRACSLQDDEPPGRGRLRLQTVLRSVGGAARVRLPTRAAHTRGSGPSWHTSTADGTLYPSGMCRKGSRCQRMTVAPVAARWQQCKPAVRAADKDWAVSQLARRCPPAAGRLARKRPAVPGRLEWLLSAAAAGDAPRLLKTDDDKLEPPAGKDGAPPPPGTEQPKKKTPSEFDKNSPIQVLKRRHRTNPLPLLKLPLHSP